MIPSPSTIEDFLGPDGLLSGSLQGFEFRPSQVQMASLIEVSLREGRPAMIEAGTGTGKTFGYLVPLILSGKKAVISTATKNLQEQLFFKDIPLLQNLTGLEIDAVVMKGRRNYLCLYRYGQFTAQGSLAYGGEEVFREGIARWLKDTEFADRSELPWLADSDVLWDALSSSSDQCLGSRCPDLEECFLNRLRKRAAQARIIIVNHHLFFSDLKVKKGGFGEIIPRFQVVVFDEAHKVEETATSYLGESLSTRQLSDFADDVEKTSGGCGEKEGTALRRHLTALRVAAEGLRAFFQEREDKARLDAETLNRLWEGPAREIRKSLRALEENFGPMAGDNLSLSSSLARGAELERLMGEILRRRDSTWLNWYERRKRAVTIHASPLDISGQMDELLYKRIETAVFTSATLAAGGTFDYMRSRLGLPRETLSALYPSHFDFERKTVMYVPADLPLPSDPLFGERAARRIGEILERTEGRALVLFTSYHNMNLAYEIVRGRVPFNLYKQGDAPPAVLLETFREDIHSVLFATGSFWEGVDVSGESLSCLIIDKLPFGSPGEPLVAARIEAIRERGGNAFMEYQVPAAIITLKQGLGRLIRKSTDRGIFSILDKRILQSRYGGLFFESLPRLSLLHDLSGIEGFLDE